LKKRKIKKIEKIKKIKKIKKIEKVLYFCPNPIENRIQINL